MIERNLSKIGQDFQFLEEIVKNTHLVNKKIENQIIKIQTNISETQSKLDRDIHNLSKKGGDKAAFTKEREELSIFNSRMENLLKRIPAIFHAEETRTIFTRLMNSLANISIKILCKTLKYYPLGGFVLKRDKERLFIKVEKLKKKLIEIEKQQEVLRANPSLKNGKKTQEKESNKLELLTIEHKKIKMEIKEQSKKIKKFDFYREKASLMRENSQNLGGERITLTTADQVKLDGNYLDAKKFRKKLSDGGAQRVVLQSQKSEVCSEKINAIYIPKENYGAASKVWDALINFEAFEYICSDSNHRIDGMGWCMVTHQTGCFFISASDLPEEIGEDANGLKQYEFHPFFEFNARTKEWETKEGVLAPLELKSIDTESPSSGTAIFSGGNGAIYETTKKEAIFFLLRNMNVMLFNFRGSGESEGIPSIAGFNLDLEAAYQCAKARSCHPDEKILFEGFCLGGVISAHVAAHHPKTHIILGKVQSSLNLFLDEELENKIRKLQAAGPFINKVKTHLEKIGLKIIKSALSIFPFYLNTSKSLAKIDGEKAIFYSFDDELLSLNHVEKNIQAIVKAGKLSSVTLMATPGDHFTSRLKVRAYPTDFSKNQAELLRKLKKEKKELASQIKAQKDLEIIQDKKIEKVKEKKKAKEEAVSKLETNLKQFDEQISLLKDQNKDDFINDYNINNVKKIIYTNKNALLNLKEEISEFDNEISRLEGEKKGIETKEDRQILEKKMAKLEVELQNLNYPDRSNMTGQLQTEHFLKKVNLMEPLINMANPVDLYTSPVPVNRDTEY